MMVATLTGRCGAARDGAHGVAWRFVRYRALLVLRDGWPGCTRFDDILLVLLWYEGRTGFIACNFAMVTSWFVVAFLRWLPLLTAVWARRNICRGYLSERQSTRARAAAGGIASRVVGLSSRKQYLLR